MYSALNKRKSVAMKNLLGPYKIKSTNIWL